MKQKPLIKPSIKGGIMAIIGVWNTHLGISIALVVPNLIYGFFAYVFLAMAGIFIINLVRILQNSSQNTPPNVSTSRIFRNVLLFGIMYIVSSTITVFNVVWYNQEIWIMYFTAFVGILWLVIGISANKWKQEVVFSHIMVSLVFAMGIFYGAISNFLIFPFYIFIFFFAAFFVQLSREYIKELPDPGEEDKPEISESNRILGDDLKILKLALIFQILGFIFAILLPFMGINNPIFILWFLIPSLILIGFASYLTWISIKRQDKVRRINLLLKIGILLELIAFFLAG